MSIVKGEVAFPEDPSTSSTTTSRRHRDAIMILLLCASLILLFVVSILAFFILGKGHFVVPSFRSSKETNETKPCEPCDHHRVVVVEMSHHDSSPHLSTVDFSQPSELSTITNHAPLPAIQVTNVDSSSISSLSPSSSSSSITAYFSAVDEGDGGDNTPKKHPPSLPAGRTTFPMMTLRSQYQHPFKPPSSLPISVRGEKNYRASNYRTFATTSSSLATSRFVTGDGQANTPQHFLVPPPPRNPGIFLPSSGEESSAGDYDDDNSTLQFRKLPSITLSLEVLEDGQPLEGNNENNSPHVNLSILRAENVDRLFQLLEEQEEKAESLPFDEALENFDHQLEQILVRIFKSSKVDNAEEELGNLEQQQFPRRNSDDEELLAETPVVPVRNPSCVDFLGLRSGEGIQLKQSDFPLRVSLHGVITNRGKEEKQVRWPLGYAILPRMDLWEMEIDEAMESLERAFDGNDDDDNSRKRKRRKRRRRRNATNNVTRKLVLHPTTTKKEQ